LYLSLKYYFDRESPSEEEIDDSKRERRKGEKKKKKKRKGKETRTKAQHNLCTTTLIKDGIIS